MYSQNDKSQAVANEDDDPLSPPLDLAFWRSLRKPREVIIIVGWNLSSLRKEPFVYGSIDYIIFFGFQCKFWPNSLLNALPDPCVSVLCTSAK